MTKTTCTRDCLPETAVAVASPANEEHSFVSALRDSLPKILVRAGIGAVTTMLAFAAPAAEGRWTEGFGQGNLEYFIDAQGMRLFIGCPTQEGSADAASSVSLMSAATSQEAKAFTVKTGGLTFEGPFTADSRVGENSFIALLGNLRKGDAVVSYAGKTITFPKSNAAKVLPAFGKKGFSCNLG